MNMKRIKPNLKQFLPLIIILFAVSIAMVLIATKPKAKSVEFIEKAWLVSAEEITKKSHSPSIKLYGKVSSLWASELKSSSATDIFEIRVIEGDGFKKNQILVKLDENEAKLRLQEREARLKEIDAKISSENIRHQSNLKSLPKERRLLELTKKEAKRFSGLAKKNVISQSALDNSQATAERQAIVFENHEKSILNHKARIAELMAIKMRLRASYDQAKLELDRCTIRAPFDGRVAKLFISPGQRVRVGDPLLEIYDTSAMIVRAQIPNRFLSLIQNSIKDGKVLRVEGQLDGTKVSAKLRSLSGLIAEGSGGAEGIFEIQVIDNYLHQGRFVKLDLILPELQNAVSLPQEAIYGSNKIYKIDSKNRIRSLLVDRVGEIRIDDSETRVIVKSPDLKTGEKIITTQLPNAVDGLLVRESSVK